MANKVGRAGRPKLQIKRDRERIAELYIKGKYQSEIAAELGLSQQQISYDLKKIQEEWLRNTTFNLDEYKTRELVKIDHLERTYWDAWERSLAQFNSKTVKGKGLTKDEKGIVSLRDGEQTIKTEDRNGDPRFLDGVMKCIERRCKMLGLDAPQKQEHTGKDGGPIMIHETREAIREQLEGNPELMEKIDHALRGD